MALPLKTERQCTLIINNVVKACQNIEKLNKTGYNFLYLCSGFIAHYNLYGFIENYRLRSLKDAILERQRQNQWGNFRQGERDAEYYHQKRDIYNEIVRRIR